MNVINTPDLEQAKKEIRKAERPTIIKAQDDNFNRKILEYGKFDILLFPQNKIAKDKPKQLDSGLNNVLAEIAEKNKITIGFDLEELRKIEKKEKAKILARIKQDIKLCRKAKIKIVLLNYKDKIDSLNFLLSLGASTQQAYFAD